MKRGAIVIALVASLAVLGTAAWPVIRIASSLKNGQKEARADFARIRKTAADMLGTDRDSAGETWRAAARDEWRTQPRLLALVVKDGSGQVLYALPGASPYYRQVPKGLAYEHPEGSTLFLAGLLGGSMSLEALYVTLSQDGLFYPIRDGALLLVALTALLAALLVVEASRGAPAGVKAAATDAPGGPVAEDLAGVAGTSMSGAATDQPSGGDRTGTAGAMTENDAPDRHADAPADESAADAADTSAADAPDDHLHTVDASGAEGSLYAEEPSTPPVAAAEPDRTEAAPPDDGCPDGPSTVSPRGLFDPVSGLGWEAYLPERLGAELRRSASFEQDLSLVLVSMGGALRGDPSFRDMATVLRERFGFRDLAFLHGDEGAAFVLPNTGVDAALKLTTDIFDKLRTGITEGVKPDPHAMDLSAGLTSRAGRLVDADRLLAEALAALNKAGTGGAMAFRPDPERFRAYLAER